MKEIKEEITPEQKERYERRCIAHSIVENMEDEAEAIKNYFPLIGSLEDGGYRKAANIIREIVSDEKNHLLVLQGMLQEFDGDIPVAEDNVQKALQSIKRAIEKDGE